MPRNAADYIRQDLRRRAVWQRVLLVSFLTMIGSLFFVLAQGPRFQTLIDPATWWLSFGGMCFVICTAATLATGLVRIDERVLAQTIILMLVLAIVALAISVRFEIDEARLLARGMPCLIFGTVIAIGIGFVGLSAGVLWRRFPDPRLMGLVGIGAVGTTTLHLKCAIDDILHIGLFHVGVFGVLFFGHSLWVILRRGQRSQSSRSPPELAPRR